MRTVDFTFENHGSICLLQPVTDAAREWTQENVGDGETQYWGTAVVIEHRYVNHIILGLTEAGLRVGNGLAGLH